jgi:fructose-bisphosphate aldolase, class I
VPIVEPEVLMDGGHSIERCDEVTETTLHMVFQSLWEQGVAPEGLLLKPSMVLPGATAPRQATVADVARATVRCLRRTVPEAVPGIVFLSGGQPDQLATAHLDAMNRLPGPQPWPLSFSYARALQTAPLTAWGGDPARVADAQRAFYHRARCNSAARAGAYTPELERGAA